MERISVPKQSEVVSPAASVPQTFHYWKMSLVPYVVGEIFCFISGVGFVRNPSADCSILRNKLDADWMCVCVCVSVVCRIAVQFNDNREDFRNEEHDGGWRQENQSGGSAVELTAARDHLTRGPSSALTCSSALFICSNHAGHIYSTILSVSQPSQNLDLAFFI